MGLVHGVHGRDPRASRSALTWLTQRRAWEVPVDPGGQATRGLSAGFCFLPRTALIEAIAVAVHFQDMDMVGQSIEQGAGWPF